MLIVKNLNVSYENSPVLQDISFTVSPGEILAVVGPNGVGKSTLIRTVSGVLPYQSGTVEVMGKEIKKLSVSERARRIAVVPQALKLPSAFTAWETVLLGRTPYLNWLGQTSIRDENIVRLAMRRTSTLEFADRRVGELSGGEQQRLLLARALSQSAPILLMDEPTSHLDLKYQLTLLEQVQTLARQDHICVLVALHDLNLVARFADRVLLLSEGKLRTEGETGGCIKFVGLKPGISGAAGCHLCGEKTFALCGASQRR